LKRGVFVVYWSLSRRGDCHWDIAASHPANRSEARWANGVLYPGATDNEESLYRQCQQCVGWRFTSFDAMVYTFPTL